MKVLFIANTVQNMYLDIYNELLRQGHEVVLVKDKLLLFDPYTSKCCHLKHVKKYMWNICAYLYWKIRIINDAQLNKPFDVLFILSGVSVNKSFIKMMKDLNSNLKTVLYTWDSCNYYRFDRLLSIVDKGYTFDIDDVEKDNRWHLLPIYYIDSKAQTHDFKYDVFSVGSNHAGRYLFFKKIMPQIVDNDIKYFIKIICKPLHLSMKERLMLVFSEDSMKDRLNEIAFSRGKQDTNILSQTRISRDDYYEKCASSRCVIDDHRIGQSGLTARFMWALALGKKIITTNDSVYKYSFVDKNHVCLIDKDKPIIDLDFVKTDIASCDNETLIKFRLDNWVKTILS